MAGLLGGKWLTGKHDDVLTQETDGFQIKAVWSYIIIMHICRNMRQLLCMTTWLQCALMHGDSHKPQ